MWLFFLDTWIRQGYLQDVDSQAKTLAPLTADEQERVNAAQEAAEIPAPDPGAPIWVVHAWLCHGADIHGRGGDTCPDGCEGAPIPDRLARHIEIDSELDRACDGFRRP